MTTPKTIGTLIKADPRFDTLIAPGTAIEVLADGYDWAEGPVWVPRDGGFLLWSDVPQNTIYKWSAGQASAARFTSRYSPDQSYFMPDSATTFDQRSASLRMNDEN